MLATECGNLFHFIRRVIAVKIQIIAKFQLKEAADFGQARCRSNLHVNRLSETHYHLLFIQ